MGDLAVEVRIESRSDSGSVVIDLVEAGERHACRIDLASGEATLSGPGFEAASPRATTAIRGRGAWKVLLANVDDELTLLVNGRRMAFDRPTTWETPIGVAEAARPQRGEPQPGSNAALDLSPAGIMAEGANVRLAEIRLLRDIYYIGAHDISAVGGMIERQRLDFPLEQDQFFVLGDNSAASKDSRLWLEGHHVDRNLLVGKALVIFWPHAVTPSWAIPLRLGRAELRLPSWPNFGRMRFVR